MNCIIEETKYYVYARRDQDEPWSNWTTAKSIEDARKHGENVKRLGYEVKVIEVTHREVEV